MDVFDACFYCYISVPLLYIDFMRIKIYTNAVIKGGCEPTMVPITLGRERSCYTNIGFKYIYRQIYEHDCRTFEDTKEATRTVNRRPHDLSPSRRSR